MPYVLDTEINRNLPLNLELQKIYGIGKKRAVRICKKLGLNFNVKLNNLPEEKTRRLVYMLKSSRTLTASRLKKAQYYDLKDLVYIRSYRGLRRINGFPVRGQRTRTNAKTAKKQKPKL